jgi:hypothetical protein
MVTVMDIILPGIQASILVADEKVLTFKLDLFSRVHPYLATQLICFRYGLLISDD